MSTVLFPDRCLFWWVVASCSLRSFPCGSFSAWWVGVGCCKQGRRVDSARPLQPFPFLFECCCHIGSLSCPTLFNIFINVDTRKMASVCTNCTIHSRCFCLSKSR